MSKYRVVARI